MNRFSIRSKCLLKAINDGVYVIDGFVYNNDGSIKKNVHISSTGYPSIYVYHNGHSIDVGIHCLIAYQKYGDKIFDDTGRVIHIRHLDSNKANYFEENIGIGSAKENMQDKPKDVRVNMAILAASRLRRFTNYEVAKIREDRLNGLKYKELCKKYNVAKSTLSYLFNNAYY